MTKQSITRILFTILISMMGTNAFAHDIAVENADGVTIYYKYINDGKELEVTFRNDSYNSYRDNVVIPEEVTYMNRTRKVTSIGSHGFFSCASLTSVTIPNSVTSIGGSAFGGCRNLTSVTIPNSVTSIENNAFNDCISLTSVAIGNSLTSIGKQAFGGCRSLTSVTITDVAAWCYIRFEDPLSNPLYMANHLFLNGEEIKDLIIPNSVTSIGNNAFYGCSGLTSVTIPNSVTSIGDGAFDGCSGLTSVTIPNSVISFGHLAFYGCSGLTSVTIGTSVTSVGIQAFYECCSLSSVTIPNSVTSIGYQAFYGCSCLTSVTIGNSVTSIDEGAFYNADIPTVISLIENPFTINGKSSGRGAFTTNTFNNATLYVPVGTIDKYKATDGWKDFLFIEEGTGPNGGGETPETKTCAKPTIGYQNGKLTFRCETEGATCHYTITDDDIKSGSANEIQLGVTYRISVYASKSGYDNSETATATLCWIDVDPKTEGITNNVAQVMANAVIIQSNNGTISVSGVEDGTSVTVYSSSGQVAGSAVASSNQASLSTHLRKDEVAIVKIGEKSVKIAMQ